jgi:hypothetical protein
MSNHPQIRQNRPKYQYDANKVSTPSTARAALLPNHLVPFFADPRIGFAAPASARTRFSGIDDGDSLDLDHEIGSG